MGGQHEPWCKRSAHSDAAKRCADNYNLHRIADEYGSIGKWIAIALQDGSSDGVLYDDKLSAVRHQHHNEQRYAFMKISPHGMALCEAEVYLETNRRLYSRGMRMTDPDHKHGGMDLITRLNVEDQLAMMRGVVQNLKMPWER
jgi:hypothetical protein